MKEYEFRKRIKANSLFEALRKDKKTKAEYAVLIDDDEEDEEEDDDKFENGKIYGFRRK